MPPVSYPNNLGVGLAITATPSFPTRSAGGGLRKQPQPPLWVYATFALRFPHLECNIFAGTPEGGHGVVGANSYAGTPHLPKANITERKLRGVKRLVTQLVSFRALHIPESSVCMTSSRRSSVAECQQHQEFADCCRGSWVPRRSSFRTVVSAETGTGVACPVL